MFLEHSLENLSRLRARVVVLPNVLKVTDFSADPPSDFHLLLYSRRRDLESIFSYLGPLMIGP